jgi:uncharacterized protein YqhQ
LHDVNAVSEKRKEKKRKKGMRTSIAEVCMLAFLAYRAVFIYLDFYLYNVRLEPMSTRRRCVDIASYVDTCN